MTKSQNIHADSFPGLKKVSLFGFTVTRSPLLGFRPVYSSYLLKKNEQNPRISNRLFMANWSAFPFKKTSKTVATSDFDCSVRLFNAIDEAVWNAH
jgi:hypothetical protein